MSSTLTMENHNGTIMGFSSEAWYLPSQDAAFVIDVKRLDRNIGMGVLRLLVAAKDWK